MSWKPMGKYVLVELHRRQSKLELIGKDVEYTSLATVIAAGEEVTNLLPGDEVLLNGNQGAIGHESLGQHMAILPAPFVLAKRVRGES